MIYSGDIFFFYFASAGGRLIRWRQKDESKGWKLNRVRGSKDDLQAFHFDADSDLLPRLLDCVCSIWRADFSAAKREITAPKCLTQVHNKFFILESLIHWKDVTLFGFAVVKELEVCSSTQVHNMKWSSATVFPTVNSAKSCQSPCTNFQWTTITLHCARYSS